ncbi:MAG: hypothetical protein ACI4VQ_06200, partial [Clostridia bacterium]
MNRETLINFIPKPTNKDVIVYDTSLKDLIDIDVLEEYNQLLPKYNFYYNQYLEYQEYIKEYEKKINNIYLYRPNWSEEDYLYALQNDKKAYSNLYGPIKRIENNIQVLQKKMKIIDDKIKIQKAKEEKKMNERKKEIDKKIEENIDKVVHLKEIQITLNYENEKINAQIKENEEDFKNLQELAESITTGECKCKYCGSKISSDTKKKELYKKIYKDIERNKKELEKILQKQNKNKEELAEYDKNIKKLKQEISNDTNFKKQEFNFYTKKSIEVLKLEADKDKILKEIDESQKKLEKNSQTKTDTFLNLKDRINKYEISLDNLKEI